MPDELRTPTSEEELSVLHEILVDVLWIARGHDPSTYRPDLIVDGDPHHHPFVFYADGEPVGGFRLDIDGDVAWMRRVAVRESEQGRGIGRRMVDHASDFARSHACRVLRSSVDRRAIGFYEKVGFRSLYPVGEEGGMLMEREI